MRSSIQESDGFAFLITLAWVSVGLISSFLNSWGFTGADQELSDGVCSLISGVAASSTFFSGFSPFFGAGFESGLGSAWIHSPERNHASSQNIDHPGFAHVFSCLTILIIFIKGVYCRSVGICLRIANSSMEMGMKFAIPLAIWNTLRTTSHSMRFNTHILASSTCSSKTFFDQPNSISYDER